MKTHRQLIALNLVLVLLLSLFPGVAFAADPEQVPEEPDSQIQTVTSDDPTVDPTEEPEPPETPSADPTTVPEPTSDPGSPDPTPTPWFEVNLRPGETKTFTKTEDGGFPQINLQADTTGFYYLHVQTPEGTDLSVSVITSADLVLRDADCYKEPADRGVYVFVLADSTASLSMEKSGFYGKDFDENGEYTLSLEPASVQQLDLNETFTLPGSPERYDKDFYLFSVTIPQDGAYSLNKRANSDLEGELLFVRDNYLTERIWVGSYSSQNNLLFNAAEGDQVLLALSTYETRDDLIVRPVESEGTFGAEGDNIRWEYDSDNGTLTFSGTGSMGSVYPIPWDAYAEQWLDVVIEDGVTDVAAEAFSGMQLRSITLPESVTKIGARAFYNCRMDSISLPAQLQSIGERAFYGCYLNTLFIPTSVTEIGAGAFAMPWLTNLTLSNLNSAYQKIDGMIYTADGKTLVCCPRYKNAPCSLPTGAETVLPDAFSFCRHVTTVYAPESLVSFGISTDCSNLKVFLYEGTAEQAETVFDPEWRDRGAVFQYGANAGDAGASIHYYAPANSEHETLQYSPASSGLYQAELTSPYYGWMNLNYFTSGGDLSLYVQSDGERVSPMIHENYDHGAFFIFEGGRNYDLRMDPIPYYSEEWELSVQRVASREILLGDNDVADGSALCCQFFSPEDGWYSFSGESEYGSRDSLRAYSSAGSGSTLYLKEGESAILLLDNQSIRPIVVTVEKQAMEGDCGENIHWSVDENGVLTISGTGGIPDYDGYYHGTHAPWKAFATSVTEIRIASGIERIGNYAFSGMENVTAVSLPSTLQQIGVCAFMGCTSLPSVAIPEGIVSIQSSAFQNCPGLNQISLPDSLIWLEEGAFWYCGALSSVSIGASLESIVGNPFEYTAVDGLTLSEQNTSFVLENGVLYDRTMTTAYFCDGSVTGDLVLPDTVETVCNCAFYCSSFSSITIPENCTHLGNSAFTNSDWLRTVTLPRTVGTIVSGFVSDCDSLTDIYYGGSVLDWYRIAEAPEVGIATVHYALEPDADSYELGEYDTDLEDGWLTFSFTAEETGVYAFTLSGTENNSIYMIKPDGSTIVHRWSYQTQSMAFFLTENQQMFILMRDWGNNESAHWSLTFEGAVSDLALGALEETNLPVMSAYRFVPEETGTYRLRSLNDDYPWFGVYGADAGLITSFYDRGNAELNAGETYYIVIAFSQPAEHFSGVFDQFHAPDPITIKLGENQLIVDGEVRCPFTPEKSGEYVFYGTSERDTYATLYDADGNWLAEDDDNGGDFQFLIRYEMEAGKTYYLGVRFYSWDSGTLTFAAERVGAASVALLSQPQDASGRVGEKVTFTVSAEGEDLTYLWQYSEDGGDTWKTSSSKTDTATCTLSAATRDGWLYRCTVTDGEGNTVTSDTAEVIVLPAITAQPKDASGKVGDVVKFTIAATGRDLTYQWQYSTDGGESWKLSSSKTTIATCTLASNRDGWIYRCIVTDARGNTVTSDTARVTVLSGPVITTQPKDASGKVGDVLKFTIAATGKDLTYQWQYSTDSGKTWKASYSKTTTATCTLATNRDGWLYRCIVTDANGVSVTSNTARVTVLSGPVITSQPKDASGKVGDVLKFTIAATGDGLKYQWQYSTDSGKTWTASSSKTTTATCTLVASRDGWLYRCIVTDANGISVTSNTARVTVQSGPVITSQPKDAVGRVGDVLKFTIAATGDGLKYQWQYSTDGGKTWKASSSKTTTATCTLVASRDGWLYRCIVTDANGNSVTSNTARVTVTSGPIITSQPQDASGKVGDVLKFTIAATGDGLTYQWQYSTDGGKTWTSSSSKTTTATCTLVASRNGWLYRCIVTDANGNSVTSNTARVTVQ